MNEKIKVREKIAYGLGDAASSMFWKIFSMYLLFFILMYLASRQLLPAPCFWSPKYGMLFRSCSRTYLRPCIDKVGKVSSISGMDGYTICSNGHLYIFRPDFSENGRLVYAYITYSVMMMVYSLINVPYASLLGVMSSDPKERTALASYRMVFAFIGSLVALWLIEPLVKIFGDGTLTFAMGWVYAMVVLVL